MKRTTLVVILLTLAVWSYPLKTASALLTEQQIEEPAQFINYEQFHEKPNIIDRQTNQSVAKPVPSGRSAAYQSSPSEYTGYKYSKEEVKELAKKYSQQYNIDSSLPLCILENESGFRWDAANRSSTARGAAQYLIGTWLSTDEGKAGRSRFDADASVLAMVKYLAIHKSAKPWIVYTKCPALKFL